MSFTETFNMLWSRPMAAVMTGFGTFWFYMLFEWNIWAGMIIGMYVTALMSNILHKPTTRGKK